jgi:hypothetical protein
MAVSDPNRREVWKHTNANVWYSVFHGTKSQLQAEAGVTVAQKVAAAIAYGAVDMTGEAAPGNIYFLEGLREVDPA